MATRSRATAPRGAGGEAHRNGRAPLRLPGIVLGVGLGGFVDGILLHQLLRWHHMLTGDGTGTGTDNIGVKNYPSNTVHGLKINTVWDGLFHTVTWLAVLAGLWSLYSRVTHARGRVWGSRVLWGWVLVGWGLFNLVEGIVDHQILAVHHVRTGPHQTWWDVGFLILGALLVAAGWAVQRRGGTAGTAGPGGTAGTASPGGAAEPGPGGAPR